MFLSKDDIVDNNMHLLYSYCHTLDLLHSKFRLVIILASFILMREDESTVMIRASWEW
jgi:hypothetical protein